MSGVEQLVGEALAHNVVLYLKDDRLAYVASGGSFPEALKREIAQNKDELAAYLRGLEQARQAGELKLPPISPRAPGAALMDTPDVFDRHLALVLEGLTLTPSTRSPA